jgi:hypothetical protein
VTPSLSQIETDGKSPCTLTACTLMYPKPRKLFHYEADPDIELEDREDDLVPQCLERGDADKLQAPLPCDTLSAKMLCGKSSRTRAQRTDKVEDSTDETIL